MRLPTTLLRVLLIISLLVNGLGVAVAGVHEMGPASASDAAARSVEPPCHAMAAHHQADDTGQIAPSHTEDGQDRHCSGLDCLRACAQQPALAVAIAHLPTTAYSMPAPTARLDQGRPAPPLPTISRPPIG